MIRDGLHHDLNWFYVVISITKAFLAKSQDTLRHETGLTFLWLPALPWWEMVLPTLSAWCTPLAVRSIGLM